MAKIAGHCVEGRLVRLAFRDRRSRKVREENVIYPAFWSKGNVLASARDAHPESTVRLIWWAPFSETEGFDPTFWIVNPRKILEYSRQGVPPRD